MKRLFGDLTLHTKILFGTVLLTLVSIVIFSFTGSNVFFNSDTATSNLLANEQIFEGRFFPKDWVYGQDIWTIFLNVPIIFLSLFMKDQLLMRAIASVVFISIAVISVLMFHKSVYNDRSWLVSIPFLFNALSITYSSIVFGQTAYLPPLIFIMLSLVLFTNSVDDKFKIINKNQFIILSLLLIYLGISGLRYIQAIGIPLLVSICVVFFIEYYSSPLKKIKTMVRSSAISFILVFLSICIGFIAFVIIKSNVHFVAGATNITYSTLERISSNFIVYLQSFMDIFGFQSGVKLFSIHGVLNGFKIITALFLLVIFPYKLIKQYNKETFKVKVFIVFSITHISIILFLSIFLNLLSGLSDSRYVITSIFLMFLLSSYYIYKYLFNKGELLRNILVFAIFIFSMSSFYLILQTSKDYQSNMSEMKSTVNFLKDKDLIYGYATYWNAGNNSVLSNFEVNINAVNIEANRISPFYWLSSYRWYKTNNHKGETFLLLTKDEKELLFQGGAEELFGIPKATYSINQFEVIVYDYNIAEKAWSAELEPGHQIYLSPAMSYNEHVEVIEEGNFLINEGGIIYGPYLDLNKGDYIFNVDIDISKSDPTFLNITARSGAEIIKTIELKNGRNEIIFNMSQFEVDVEFVLVNSNSSGVYVKNIFLSVPAD